MHTRTLPLLITTTLLFAQACLNNHSDISTQEDQVVDLAFNNNPDLDEEIGAVDMHDHFDATMESEQVIDMRSSACSVGVLCDGECVDLLTNTKHCGQCGSMCSEEGTCIEGLCQVQNKNCRDESCLGFYYCDLASGECVAGCDRDEQCDVNSVCDVFSHECECASGYHECGATCVDSTLPQNCGTRCQPCPSPPNGSGTCNTNGTCGVICDSGYHLCGDLCVADNSVNHCGDRCEPCESEVGSIAVCTTAMECGVECETGYQLCGTECSACPTSNVTSTVCNEREECVIDSCAPGTHPCGDRCCGWAASHTQVVQFGEQPQYTFFTRSANYLSLSYATQHSNTFTYANTFTHWLYDASINQWSLAYEHELSLSSRYLPYFYGFNWAGQNYAVFGESQWVELSHTSGPAPTTSLQRDYIGRGAKMPPVFQSTGGVHFLIGGDASGNRGLYSVNPTTQVGFVYTGVDWWEEFDVVNVNPSNNIVGMLTYSPRTSKKDIKLRRKNWMNPSNSSLSMVHDCVSQHAYRGDFPFVLSDSGLATVLRSECDGVESAGLWASTEISAGVWDHTLLSSNFTGRQDGGDVLGDIVVGEDGTLHVCFVTIDNAMTAKTSVYYGWRSPDPQESWNIERVSSPTDARDCFVQIAPDAKVHMAWYRHEQSNLSNPWVFEHLASQ